MTGDLLAFTTAALFAGALAVFVLVRRKRSAANLSFALGMIAIAASESLAALGSRTSIPHRILQLKQLELVALALLPGAWLTFSLSFARSNAKEILSRWKAAIAGSFLVPLALVTVFRSALFAVPENADAVIGSLLPLGWSGAAFYVVFLLVSVCILANLESTLRATRGGKRWRVKFMLIGIGSFFAVRVYLCSEILLYSSLDPLLRPLASYATLLTCVLVAISLARTREMTAELRVSPRLFYNSVAGLLVASYLIAVGVVSELVQLLGGGAGFPWAVLTVFVLLVVLSVLLLSDQVREELRRLIVQNFYAPGYDYRKEWTGFTRRTASLVDAEELCSAVSRIVSETFGVDSVTIWRVGEGDLVSLGGSTALSQSEMRSRRDFQEAAECLVRCLRERTEPADLDELGGSDADKLRSSSEFLRLARIRHCVPLVAARTFVGVMTLSERITGDPFTLEDLDLLRTIADEAAANLLNLHLSEQVATAKEMEAFQALSTFFVHDLKNLASMLSLTVQNLPKNYDDPEFREDALKIISESVEKMNAMCRQLSLLNRTLELRREETDLNRLVRDVVARVNGSLRVTVLEDLRPLPLVPVDRGQLEKVLTNLFLNANDAIDDGGEIRLATEERDGWVVLSVSDTGRGMSEEFLNRRLFRPFQTTKSHGLGIGLFQSKRLVEAHGGRIEVESREGIGTSFRIRLPMSPTST